MLPLNKSYKNRKKIICRAGQENYTCFSEAVKKVVSFPSMSNEWLTQSAKTRISNLLESRFSESAERIEAKSISSERYFKAQDR